MKADVKEGEKTADGHPVFPAEAGRYHLVVSANCPFCHRTTVLRALKGLEVLKSYLRPALHHDIVLVLLNASWHSSVQHLACMACSPSTAACCELFSW